MKFKNMELRSLAILHGLPEQLLSWLADRGTKMDLAKQEHLFSKGEIATLMFFVVSGTIQRYEEIAGQMHLAATIKQGQVTGMLPYSRMTHYPGDAVAIEPSLVLCINKKDFSEMLSLSYELGQRLVAEMSNRVRGGVRLEQQREKMVSLGRLSAGLAHELNNPASAILSTSIILLETHTNLQQKILKILKSTIDKDALNVIEKQLLPQTKAQGHPFTPLELDERKEGFAAWLEKMKIDKAWNISTILAHSNLQIEDLQSLSNFLYGDQLNDVLSWISHSKEIDQMMIEIHSAAENITDLISTIKMYSHMDQSLESKATDIREGLDNTLKMFAHKIRDKNINIVKDYPDNLPFVSGNIGDLNQVWTNLIDNAIYALPYSGQLRVDIKNSDRAIEVRIIDNGKGIPEEIIHNIFDPLFTTKEVGESTGLGLDIAQRIIDQHGGQIEAFSKPGKTELFVMLPFLPAKGE